MDLKAKKALIIDLGKRTSSVKSFTDLQEYIGGVGLGLKLMEIYKDQDPIIFSIGPLNGFFPFASKTAIIINDEGAVEDIYLGGSLSLRIRYSGVDALVFINKANEPLIIDIIDTQVTFKDPTVNIKELGLPGKRSLFDFETEFLLDGYFTTPGDYLEKIFIKKGIKGLSITGTEKFTIPNFEKYQILYNQLLERKNELSVEEGIYPSCSNCPMGCGKSKRGEMGGNVLIHSLVACQFADKIYSDIGIVFSCLNSLGYDYKHEDLENLPILIERTLKKLQ